jgi:hypothetical protein
MAEKTNLVTASGESIVFDESPLAGIGMPYVIAKSGSALSVGSTTAETVLATVDIPGGTMGPNGWLIVYSSWTITNGSNDKTVRIRLGGIGGTAFLQSLQTTQATISDVRWIANRGSQASQVGPILALSPFAASTDALITGTIDTSAATTLVFTGQKESAGEVCTLSSYLVQVVYGA